MVNELLSKYWNIAAIKAGKSHGGCWPFPKLYTSKHDPNELIYEVKRQVVSFLD